jgi:hypothetical protein
VKLFIVDEVNVEGSGFVLKGEREKHNLKIRKGQAFYISKQLGARVPGSAETSAI